MSDTGIGAAVRRKEDYRFLTGKGNYTDDINRRGQVYAYFVRSNLAHARIKSLDTKAAKSAAGVVAVFTGDDLAADGVGGIPCGFAPDGGPMKEPPRPALAQGTVRFVGDMVAVVIAESLGQAKDAAELIEIDYEELPAVVSPAAALKSGAPQLHDEAPNNICFEWGIGDKDATDKAFDSADHITRLDLVNNRKCPSRAPPSASTMPAATTIHCTAPVRTRM
jgi:carbon-monoxide dehydrogenase large subunit